jgi:hypothetical protein
VVSGGAYVVLAAGTVAASMLHYAVLPRGYHTPSPEAVVTKTVAAAVVSGEYSLSLAATTMELAIGGLSPDSTYTVYCVAALGSHVGVAQAYVTALDVQTTVPTAPTPTITVTRGMLPSAASEAHRVTACVALPLAYVRARPRRLNGHCNGVWGLCADDWPDRQFDGGYAINSASVTVSVAFDRPVSQFDCIPSGACGLNVSAATARAVTFAVNPSLDRRTFLIGVTLLADGPVVLSVAPGAAHDVYDILQDYGVGVSSAAATPFQWTHDATSPTVTLSEVSLSSRHMIFRVEFSEDVVRGHVIGCRPFMSVSRLRVLWFWLERRLRRSVPETSKYYPPACRCLGLACAENRAVGRMRVRSEKCGLTRDVAMDDLTDVLFQVLAARSGLHRHVNADAGGQPYVRVHCGVQ